MKLFFLSSPVFIDRFHTAFKHIKWLISVSLPQINQRTSYHTPGCWKFLLTI